MFVAAAGVGDSGKDELNVLTVESGEVAAEVDGRSVEE